MTKHNGYILRAKWQNKSNASIFHTRVLSFKLGNSEKFQVFRVNLDVGIPPRTAFSKQNFIHISVVYKLHR